eukprot:1138563-Pelagomonas_calceolata.AAC.1
MCGQLPAPPATPATPAVPRTNTDTGTNGTERRIRGSGTRTVQLSVSMLRSSRRSPVNPAISPKSFKDAGTWAWLGGPAADINDAEWLLATEQMLSEVAKDTNLSLVGSHTDPREYRKGVKMYMDMVEVRFYEQGARGNEGTTSSNM